MMVDGDAVLDLETRSGPGKDIHMSLSGICGSRMISSMSGSSREFSCGSSMGGKKW